MIVHGGWGSWDDYSSCSATCGGGKRTRKQRCNNPLPAHKGNFCSFEGLIKDEYEEGELKIEAKPCNLKKCPSMNIDVSVKWYLLIDFINFTKFWYRIFFKAWNDAKETSCSKSCGANAFKNITRICSHDKETCMSEYNQNETYCFNGGCPLIKDEVFLSPCHLDSWQGI